MKYRLDELAVRWTENCLSCWSQHVMTPALYYHHLKKGFTFTDSRDCVPHAPFHSNKAINTANMQFVLLT